MGKLIFYNKENGTTTEIESSSRDNLQFELSPKSGVLTTYETIDSKFNKKLINICNWTVGYGEDNEGNSDKHFQCLQEALDEASCYSGNNKKLIITLKKGYIIDKTINIVNTDLRHVEILSEDNWVVAQSDNFTTNNNSDEHQGEKNVFNIHKSFAPYFGIKIDIRCSYRISGYTISNCSDFNVINGKFGIKGASGFGVNIINSSRCNLSGSEIHMKDIVSSKANNYSAAVLLDNSSYGMGYGLKIYNLRGNGIWATQGCIGTFSLTIESVDSPHTSKTDGSNNFVNVSNGTIIYVDVKKVPRNLNNHNHVCWCYGAIAHINIYSDYIKGGEIFSNIAVNNLTSSAGAILSNYTGG